MHAALIWVVVNLVHPSPYATGYAYPALASCQHAMNVFALSSQQWACRSIEVLPESVTPTQEVPKTVLDRSRQNGMYDEARLHALVAPHVRLPR